jgi:hypothetical protein
MAKAKYKATRVKDGEFCTLEVEVRAEDTGPVLSICGVHGRVVKRAVAKREALEYWASYFEDCPDAIIEMNRRFNRRFTSTTGAARFVVECDGEFHGLDVMIDADKRVYIGESFGQIRETIAEWFPEAIPFLPYHLNNMNAACEHQRAQGMTWITHPLNECEVCEHELGKSWIYEPLPENVIEWAKSVPNLSNVED